MGFGETKKGFLKYLCLILIVVELVHISSVDGSPVAERRLRVTIVKWFRDVDKQRRLIIVKRLISIIDKTFHFFILLVSWKTFRGAAAAAAAAFGLLLYKFHFF